MNLLHIIDFYIKNSLALTGVNYDDKLCHFDFFGGKTLTIDTVTDYCQYRALQGVKNATINRELTIVRSAVNFHNKHHDHQLKNPLNGFKSPEEELVTPSIAKFSKKFLKIFLGLGVLLFLCLLFVFLKL